MPEKPIEKLISMPKYELSPSSLNLLEDCPRCFWLQLVKKIRRPNGAFPSNRDRPCPESPF